MLKNALYLQLHNKQRVLFLTFPYMVISNNSNNDKFTMSANPFIAQYVSH
jgi:hypothetical protein